MCETHHASASGVSKLVLLYGALAAAAFLLMLALGLVLSGRRGGQVAEKPPGEEETAASQATLLLDWPAQDRRGATVSLNGRDETVLLRAARGDRVKLTLRPGKYAVRIERPGYGPYSEEVTIAEGQSATVAPAWKAVKETPQPSDFPVIPKPGPPPEKPQPPEPKPEEKPEEKPEPKPEEKPAAEEKPQPKPAPKVDPVIQAREEKWRAGMQPVEEAAAAWDFAAAQAAIERVKFDEPELQQRLARRADELRRMAALKSKIIGRIKSASPRLRKSDLMLRGISGEVTGADEQAIRAELAGGKTEDHPWAELNEKARPKLLELAVDPSSADDWLGAGLMAFAAGDVPLAERLLDKARALGTDTGSYLGPLAAGMYAQARRLIDAGKWTEAQKRLDELQEKYAATPWFGENRALVDEALAAVKAGFHEAEAEKLYAEAAELFKKQDLFSVRPLVEKLKGEYPATAAVTDAARKPSFAELEQAVANLGKMLTVRLDGKGDFKTIQAAIDAAPARSLIEVQDNGPYREMLRIPQEQEGLCIRGKKGCRPIITSWGKGAEFSTHLVLVEASGVALEGLVLVHFSQSSQNLRALSVHGRPFHLRSVTVYVSRSDEGLYLGAESRIEDSLILTGVKCDRSVEFLNCLIPVGMLVQGVEATVSLDLCTLRESGPAGGTQKPLVLKNSIAERVRTHTKGMAQVQFCDVYGKTPYGDKATPGEHCFTADPQFVNPPMLDYRLQPTSPCRGKASDGGDIGCRFTPEMLEMCKIALELRAKGIIKF